jgi:sterol desaturase/sphingolipid hydroxylase (fatty acid hydroxylase superfamily)
VCKSPIVKLVYVLSLWIAVVACLDLGAFAIWRYRPLEKLLETFKLQMLFMPLHYVVGVAGLIILIGLLMYKGGMGHFYCGD